MAEMAKREKQSMPASAATNVTGGAASTKANGVAGGFPPYAHRLLLQSFLLGLIPPIALLAAIILKNLVLLTYTHVMSAVMWTGFDLFMALILGRVLRSLDTAGRVEIAKRLTPSTFFILPSLAATTITAGIYLAMSLGIFNFAYYWIVAALVIVAILAVQGFVILMPNSMKIFIELAKPKPEREKIAKLNGINIRLAGVQGAFQILIIFIMVNISNLPNSTAQFNLPAIMYSLIAFAALFLGVYLFIYRGALSSYRNGELDKRAIDTLRFGLYGHIVIFLILGSTLAFA
ncbi:MAG: hypothetical protein M1305_05785 [Candidatus Marsarchaeota archaeon]|nr:hypothetical protein [Candidatus Marsarchaeota archaeon]